MENFLFDPHYTVAEYKSLKDLYAVMLMILNSQNPSMITPVVHPSSGNVELMFDANKVYPDVQQTGSITITKALTGLQKYAMKFLTRIA